MDIPILTRLDRVLQASAVASSNGQRGNYSSIAKALGSVAGIHLDQCLQHLTVKGYLHSYPPDVTLPARGEEQWVISIAGERLLDDGGFRAKSRRKWWKRAWVVMKTVSTVVYSLAVLAVAIWAVWVQMDKP